MASRPKRLCQRTVRYGFDESEDEPEETGQHLVDVDTSHEDEESGSDSSDEDERTDIEHEEEWQIIESSTDAAPQLQFIGDQGWKIEQPVSLEEYVKIFLPDSLIQKLCQWTNSRADIDKANAHEHGEEFKTQWVPVNVSEMKTFIGLTLCMGIVRKNTLDSYWSTEALERTEYFPKCMARDRYRQLLRFLRFSDPYNINASDVHNVITASHSRRPRGAQ